MKEGQSEDSLGGYCLRRSLWSYSSCKGKLKRSICNLGVEDLPVAVNPECNNSETGSCFFVNKLDLKVDPLSVTCLAQHVVLTGGSCEPPVNNACFPDLPEALLALLGITHSSPFA